MDGMDEPFVDSKILYVCACVRVCVCGVYQHANMHNELAWLGGCGSSLLCLFSSVRSVSVYSDATQLLVLVFSFLSSCLGFCFLFLFVHLPRLAKKKEAAGTSQL